MINEFYLKTVFDEIEKGIRDGLKKTDALVFESTGLTDHFDRMLQSLKMDFQVVTIGVNADSATCLNRVKAKAQTIHINVSDEQVLMINEKVKARDFKTDFYIETENKFEHELINYIKGFVGLNQSNKGK